MKNLIFILATILLFASCQKPNIVNNNPTNSTIDYRRCTMTVIDVVLSDTLINNLASNDAMCNSMVVVTNKLSDDTLNYIATQTSPNSNYPNLCLAFFPNVEPMAISTKVRNGKSTLKKQLEVAFEFRRPSDGTFWNSIADANTISNHLTSVEYQGQHIVTLDYDNDVQSTTKSDTLDVYIIKGYFTKSFGRLNSMEQRDFKVIYECPLFLKK